MLSPERLLSAPRRSAGLPNSSGSMVLFSTTSYSFDEHKSTTSINVLDVQSNDVTTILDNVKLSDLVWLDDDRFLGVQQADKGRSALVLCDAATPGLQPVEVETFAGSVANVKIKKRSDGSFAFACTAVATPDGIMYNEELAVKPHSSARIYSKLCARFWDTWLSENKGAIWYGILTSNDVSASFKLRPPGLVNLLQGTGLECPIPPFGGLGDYDISETGLAFVALDPATNPALSARGDLYFVNLVDFDSTHVPVINIVHTAGLEGFSGHPAFSHDGRSIAFTRMKEQHYDILKSRLLLVPDVSNLSKIEEFYETKDGKGGWDRSPDGIIWSADDSELYVMVEDIGRVKLFKLSSRPDRMTKLPETLTTEGSVLDVQLFGIDRLFLSQSSFEDSSFYSIIDPANHNVCLLSSHLDHGKVFGLSRGQVDEMWFQGGGDYDVHAWMIKPSSFDEDKRWPVVFIIHGGPESCLPNAWSTRWNLALWAEQGYVVVAPDFTGSTGYGAEFQDGVVNNYGGRPYEDVVKCFEHVERSMPFADTSRAIAAGGSYGGYLINWIQGHPLGRKLKALVCHSGVFTSTDLASDLLLEAHYHFGGPVWERRSAYDKWDVSKFLDQWATPQLITHGELDYRVPITDGLAAFHVLQSRGVESKLVVFPDENHFILNPENSLVWHREVFDWIKRYTTPR